MPWDKDAFLTPLPEPSKPQYINDLIEDANNDMKVSLIREFNEEEGSTTLKGYNDIIVEMKWEVINE